MSVCITYPCRRTSAGCPVCDPPASLPPYIPAPSPVFHPPGCICPPTSEKTCESPTCPRKGIKVSGARLGG
jgi:hypothetical protein